MTEILFLWTYNCKSSIHRNFTQTSSHVSTHKCASIQSSTGLHCCITPILGQNSLLSSPSYVGRYGLENAILDRKRYFTMLHTGTCSNSSFFFLHIFILVIVKYQLLQQCTAHIAWSDSVFRFASISISVFMFVVTKC